jgi:hypothetical protein
MCSLRDGSFYSWKYGHIWVQPNWCAQSGKKEMPLRIKSSLRKDGAFLDLPMDCAGPAAKKNRL